MSERKEIEIVWFRNNLRIHDNICLKKAIEGQQTVVGFVSLDPRYFKQNELKFRKTERFRALFWLEAIQDLKGQLKDLNIPLFVGVQSLEKDILEIDRQFSVQKVYHQKEWTQEEVQDNNLWSKITSVESYYDQFLFHPNDVFGVLSEIPNVFTEFRKKCEKTITVHPVFSTPPALPAENYFTSGSSIPSLEDLGFQPFEQDSRSAFPFRGGESEAEKRLDYYLWKTKKLSFYKKTRNGLLGANYSSKFSPWLAFGCISARSIYWEIKSYEKEIVKNQSTYWLIFELVWRDYFKFISLKHGNQIFQIHGIKENFYAWNRNLEKFKKWTQGQTPESFVNANMIELNTTGFMSNRGRQNVASYLAKEWHIDWRWGAAYFEAMLIDYDVHSNYGNWMYNSGVGNDPRNRKFNIGHQAERYDPKGTFQNTWLQKTLF